MKTHVVASKERKPTKGGSLPRSLRALRSVLSRDGNRARHAFALESASRLREVKTPCSITDALHDLMRQRVAEHRVEATVAVNGNAVSSHASGAHFAVNASVHTHLHVAPQLDLLIPRWKRALDLILISYTWPLWLPVMLVVMVTVWLSSPGPIFYRQERVGHRGRRFMILKFRSMRVDADPTLHQAHFKRLMEEGVPMEKLDNTADPRIIPLGRFLRATGLDELPQLFNVILGDMSLVGPRPCIPHEFEGYQPWQQARVNAPPGMTGLWQVSGKNRTTFNEMIEMDIRYATDMCIALDCKILAKTGPALMSAVFDLGRRSRAARSGQQRAADSARTATSQAF